MKKGPNCAIEMRNRLSVARSQGGGGDDGDDGKGLFARGLHYRKSLPPARERE